MDETIDVSPNDKRSIQFVRAEKLPHKTCNAFWDY